MEDRNRAPLWDAGLLAAGSDGGGHGQRCQNTSIPFGPAQQATPGMEHFRSLPLSPSQEPLMQSLIVFSFELGWYGERDRASLSIRDISDEQLLPHVRNIY